MKKKFLLSLLIFNFFSVLTYAQDMDKAPHAKLKTGVINGQLIFKNPTGKENPLAKHTVFMAIFKNDQLVLVIDKKTDDNGHYSFSNIFQAQDFHYSVFAVHNQEYFLTDDISLKSGEKERTANLIVRQGQGIAEKDIPFIQKSLPTTGQVGSMDSSTAHQHQHTQPISEVKSISKQVPIYLSVAIILGLVAFLVVWQRKE